MSTLLSIISWIAWGYLAFVLAILFRRLAGENPNVVYNEEDCWGYIIFGPIALLFTLVSLIFKLPWKNIAVAFVETIVAIKNKSRDK